jgi:hypothetical protein
VFEVDVDIEPDTAPRQDRGDATARIAKSADILRQDRAR